MSGIILRSKVIKRKCRGQIMCCKHCANVWLISGHGVVTYFMFSCPNCLDVEGLACPLTAEEQFQFLLALNQGYIC